MHLRTFLSAFLSYRLCVAYSSSSDSSPTATLDSGVIIGTTTLLPSSTVVVNKFLGIPFTSPPERFAAPVAPVPWGGQLNTTEAKPACIQAFICTSPFMPLYGHLPIWLLLNLNKTLLFTHDLTSCGTFGDTVVRNYLVIIEN
jgi:hypothetical protein